jgi:V/A-type H+-transporting ATPase subunit K
MAITDLGSLYGMIAIGAGLATGLAGIGAGMGEQGIGAAVVGVVAEEPGFLGKGLFLMLLPETLIIFGLAVSLILMFAWTPFGQYITVAAP